MQPAEIAIDVGPAAQPTRRSSASQLPRALCSCWATPCAMRCPRCCDTVTVNGVLEALTVIASAADMVTDLLVLVQFYLDGQDTFFIISLCVILLAQVTFALTFTVERAEVRGDTWRAHRRRLAIFVGVFPVAQLVPILAYLTSTFELPRLQRLLKRLGVGGESEPRAPGTTSWEKVKNKVHAHRGFLLEAFAEAIPQCALQLIAALTVDHFTTLSAISIFLSISVIASKSWVVAWSPHAPTMAFNTLCIVADIVGFFASLAWLFAVDQLPAVHAMHQSLRGWLLGVISLTALGGASCLGLFALAVLFDELRFQTSRAEHARGPRRNWPKKFLWVPPAMVPLLYWLALVPVGVIYLLARWTLVALCCGTMGQQEKEKLHRDIVDRMLAFIEHGKTLTPRSFRQGSYRFRRRLGGGPTRRRLPLASLIDETQQGLVRLPPGLTMATQQELRERALITLLRLATAEHKHSLKGLPAVARRGMHENGREILATRLAVAGHRGAPGAIVADAAAAASGRSTGSRRSLWPASTRTTSASRPQGAATGAGGAAGEVNANMARGLDSRTLRWLVLLLVQRSCFHSPRQRANAKLTLQTQALGPCSDGRLSGLLQAGAGLMFGSAAVVGVLWLLLSIPLLVLSVIYPLLQPILYGAARLGDDGRDWPPPPILAPILSVCCFMCVVALPPLRFSRRSSNRIQLSNTLIQLCENRRFTDTMLLTIEQRCSVAAAAAAEDEELASRTAPLPEDATRRRRLNRVRFDDDCSLCCRKVASERGVRLFLDAAFLGPSACNGADEAAATAETWASAGGQGVPGTTAATTSPTSSTRSSATTTIVAASAFGSSSSNTMAPLPHLPEGIRRLIYAYTRVGATSAATTLSCGHRFHQSCLECAPQASNRNSEALDHSLLNAVLGLPSLEPDERDRWGSSARGALELPEYQPECPECAALVDAATCIWTTGAGTRNPTCQ